MKIKLFDYNAKESGEVEIAIEKIDSVNSDLITQYVRMFLLSQRQGTSSVKGKGEVRGGGKKPWRQKGTGRARSGSSRSPLWTGGGVSHGPNQRNWSFDLSKKMKQKAFLHCVYSKVQDGVIKAFEYSGNGISTKGAASFIKKIGSESSYLVVHSNDDKVFKSFRNVPFVDVKSIDNLSVFDIFKAKSILLESKSIEVLNGRLS